MLNLQLCIQNVWNVFAKMLLVIELIRECICIYSKTNLNTKSVSRFVANVTAWLFAALKCMVQETWVCFPVPLQIPIVSILPARIIKS